MKKRRHADAYVTEKAFAILDMIAIKFEIPVADLIGKCRTERIVEARHIAIHLVRRSLNLTRPVVAELFQREESSIGFAQRNVTKWACMDQNYDRTLRALTAKCAEICK